MNIHPMLVHFPIALLTLYSVIEILPLEKWFGRISWKSAKIVLLSFGTLGAAAAALAGEEVAEMIPEGGNIHEVIEVHAAFAVATIVIFGVLIFTYLIKWIVNLFGERISPIVRTLTALLTNRFVTVLLALTGLVAITVTGALGGGMAKGPDVDPVARFVYDFFF